jgi:signal transduction histidine kinase
MQMNQLSSEFVAVQNPALAFIRRLVASNVKTFAAIVLTWTIVAVIATTTAFIAIRGDRLAIWMQIFGPMLLYYSVWVVISLLIYRIVQTLHGSPARRALAVAAHLGLFMTVTLSLPFIVHFSDWQTWLYGARAPGFHTLAAVIYVLNLVGSLLIRFYRLSVARDREARDARLRSSLLENQLNLARMDALKMQINPHFLFNALNSIAALIETDRNVEAYHTTELLGGLLRSALDQSSDRFLSLEQELEFVRRYVDVEKIRFGSRISFDVQIDADCKENEVPALILQPLIENSIKHAVNRSADVVSIVLLAKEQNGKLLIELTDNGPGMSDTNGIGDGYGLGNIRKRLELLYDGAARFDVSNRPQGGVRAALTLPLDTVTPLQST